MRIRTLIFLLLSLNLLSLNAASTQDCRQLSIYQIMTASFQRVETGTTGFTDLWGPKGHRTDGNLKGVTASLDYIKKMGFNAIWMTPIFDCTNGIGGEKLQATGYFATDYFNIDPRFGTKEDFRELTEEAHKRGIHVILDLVAGHHGGNPAASPSGKKIITRADTPNDLNFLPGNIVYPGSLPFFKEVIRYWMDEFGVDGWRLDQCYQVCQGGHNYWKELREEAEKVAAERKARGEQWGTLAYMVGEDWNQPNNIITTHQDGLKSVFDFERQTNLLWLPDGVGEIQKAYSNPTLRGYDDGVITNLFLGNHDMGRVGSYIEDVKSLLFRYAILAAYSGPVTFFYGDEFALKNGDSNDDNRGRVSGRLVPENEQEKWLSEMTAKLFEIRGQHPAMWRGICQYEKSGNTLQVIKTDPQSGERIAIVFPMESKSWNFPAGAINLLTDMPLSGKVSALEPVIYTLPKVDTSDYSKEQKANPGEVTRYYLYSSRLDDTYAVDVWVPADYNPKRSKPYPVIYAQDGQNLFDPSATWNGQSWNLDAVSERLGTNIDTPVIVGIHNRPTRSADYLPHSPLTSNPSLEQKILNGWGQSESRSDRYLDFMVNTIKPFMEGNYNIRHDASGVTALGSSMGGLISLYAMCEYPKTFGNAICMSTHWLGFDYTCAPAFPQAMLSYLGDKLPADGRHRLYLDHGTLGFDASYEPWDSKAYEVAVGKGYEPDKSVMHYIDEGADHNETCWSQRVDKPLQFVFGTDPDLPEPENVKVWLYYEEAPANDTFYCFVYDSQVNNKDWPGEKMAYRSDVVINDIAGNWYVYDVPDKFTYTGLAMVTDNGTRRYPSNMEPGIPLDGKSLVFIYQKGNWTTTRVESLQEGVSTLKSIESYSPYDLDAEDRIEIYSLDGNRVVGDWSTLNAGIYIVRSAKGTAKMMKTK